MATMYSGSGTVTHESDDTRPGKALCGRSIVGALNLTEMSGWERIGFDAASNGPCANCSRKLHSARTAPAPAPAPALISTDANTGARTYIGPAIHDGSPAEHVTAALSAAQDHSVPAVREYLTRALTTQLARTTPSARTR